MKITDITFGMLRVPLKTPFKTALRTVDTVEDIVVIVKTDTGHVGYGEAPATAVITGDTHGSIIEAIAKFIRPRLIGQDIANLNRITDLIQTALERNTSAKAAVEIAVYDLWAQLYDAPLYKMLGGGGPVITTGITINVGKSDKAKANPLGRDARVREAFELSLDRQGLVQVVMDNEAIVGNQWVPPSNAFYAKNVPVPKRDIARAKQLLKEAGVPNPSFTLVTPTTSDAQRIALVVQAMTREAGFDVKIQAAEFATSLNMADKGDFEAYVLAWSGRPDPDGNLYSFHACKQPLNYAGYCDAETDKLINESRAARDPAERGSPPRRSDRTSGRAPCDRPSTCPPAAATAS